MTHYQFMTWPDFGVPKSTEDFLEFLEEVRRSGCLNISKHGPPVVHCSAGIGRSGTFVIVDAVLVMVRRLLSLSWVEILGTYAQMSFHLSNMSRKYHICIVLSWPKSCWCYYKCCSLE